MYTGSAEAMDTDSAERRVSPDQIGRSILIRFRDAGTIRDEVSDLKESRKEGIDRILTIMNEYELPIRFRGLGDMRSEFVHGLAEMAEDHPEEMCWEFKELLYNVLGEPLSEKKEEMELIGGEVNNLCNTQRRIDDLEEVMLSIRLKEQWEAISSDGSPNAFWNKCCRDGLYEDAQHANVMTFCMIEDKSVHIYAHPVDIMWNDDSEIRIVARVSIITSAGLLCVSRKELEECRGERFYHGRFDGLVPGYAYAYRISVCPTSTRDMFKNQPLDPMSESLEAYRSEWIPLK